MAFLGEMHRLGRGVAVDFKQAKAWYEKAAAGKHALGTFGLGLLALNGLGMDVDYQTAFQV